MKKSILGLLSLLLLLILFCIYQKSEAMYALSKPIEVEVIEEESTIASPKIALIKKPILMKIENNSSKETGILLKEIKVSVKKLLVNKKEKHISPAESEKVLLQAIEHLQKKKTIKKITSVEEKEIINYFLTVMIERDKVMNRLKKVIQNAKYNRRIAIENMNNVFIELENTQARLFKEREASSYNASSQEKGQ
jgi:hypothetical protein